MAIIKKREIDVLAQMNGDELERFVESLPAGKDKIEGLFDFLEMKLETNTCDHTSRFAMQFMMQNTLNFAKLSAWLSRNGGYCDCKIVSEIAEIWREVFDES
ncbi:MAG: DUF2695 domain-containing protein [Acidobacteriota bacterium]|nr:DUF2695 domain-containing protein [Acidobacteriota bacterium]MDH3529933.1 DUF2695 domain-containing protein [Acidobacteriota bacterium]